MSHYSLTVVYMLKLTIFIYLFIYYWIIHEVQNRQNDRNSKWKKQHIQPGYNPTHTLENRSTISSHVNWTDRINNSSLATTMSCKRLHIIYHEIVREVHKKCMKLQTSSRSQSNERDIVLLRITINSNKAQIWQQHLNPIYEKFCEQICGFYTTWISCNIESEDEFFIKTLTQENVNDFLSEDC